MSAVTIPERLQRMLEQTLLPSPNVEALHPSSIDAFVGRLQPGQPDIAEMYHLNSRLTRVEAGSRLDLAEADAVRAWYLDNGGKVLDGDITTAAHHRSHGDLPEPLGHVLSAFGPDGPMKSLLFSCDLVVLYDGAVWRQAPGDTRLTFEHDATPEDLAAIAGAPVDPGARDAFLASHAVFAIVGVPWRNMLITGPRGYRRMLLDAGMLLSALGSMIHATGLEATPSVDFYDDEVDRPLGHDGIERSVIAFVAMTTPTPAVTGGDDEGATPE